MKKVLATCVSVALAMPLFATQFITIGTGGVTGTYYPTGGAVCRMVNKKKKETKIRCSVESTGGSVYNVNNIKAGELDFGTVQSDVAYQAYKGEGNFADAPFKELRSVMAIYPELLALVVRKDSGINEFKDIKGKRINLGNPGSGQANTAPIIMEKFGLKDDDLKLAGVLKAPECPAALTDNKIDGYFYMVGHPTANIKDASNSVAIDIIDINSKEAKEVVDEHPYYAFGVIPAGTYSGVDRDVTSIGVKAVLVTSADVDDKAVELIVSTILENFDDFKELHPAYKGITKESLLEGTSVPLHKAAEAYYKKVGLIK